MNDDNAGWMKHVAELCGRQYWLMTNQPPGWKAEYDEIEREIRGDDEPEAA